MSEFSFYSFSGGFDTPEERGKRPSFQQWLDQRLSDRGIQVVEHPTIDLKPLDPATLEAATRDIEHLLSSGRTVVLMDSGGETRTGRVCRFAGFVEDPRT